MRGETLIKYLSTTNFHEIKVKKNLSAFDHM